MWDLYLNKNPRCILVLEVLNFKVVRSNLYPLNVLPKYEKYSIMYTGRPYIDSKLCAESEFQLYLGQKQLFLTFLWHFQLFDNLIAQNMPRLCSTLPEKELLKE